VEDALEILSVVLCPAVILLPPAVLLLSGWLSLRTRKYDRAESCASLAGIWTWGQLGLEVPLVVLASLQGVLPWDDPFGLAIVSYPPMMWVFARMLRKSVAENREKDRIAWRADREKERERRKAGQE
jgi:hypothetical protein